MAQHAQAVCQATTDAYWWGYLNRKRASLAVGCNVAQVRQLRPRLGAGLLLVRSAWHQWALHLFLQAQLPPGLEVDGWWAVASRLDTLPGRHSCCLKAGNGTVGAGNAGHSWEASNAPGRRCWCISRCHAGQDHITRCLSPLQ